MADQNLAALKQQLTKVLGDSGTERYSGYFTEEENPLWRDSQRIDLVKEMRDTDGSVAAVLKGLKAPILSTEWSVHSPDETPRGEEIRQFVEDNIFHMERDWKEFLREALGFFDFGHYCFELVVEMQDGKLILADLAPRIPASIEKWQISDGKPGITQLIQTDEYPAGQKAEIPMQKLLVLTNDKEGDDLTGKSVLRAAYKHYKYKDVLYRVSGIAVERYGVGVPRVKMTENYGSDDKDEAEELAENLRSNEKSFIVQPQGYEIDIITPNGNPMFGQIDALIEHHNRMIKMSTLQQFLDLGADGVGSLALSQDHSSFFLQHVEEKAQYFATQFNRQVIRRLVDVNFGPQDKYPELTFSPLGTQNEKEMAEVLNILSMAGLLEVDAELRQWVRKSFYKLPQLTDEQMEDDKESDDVEEEESDDVEEKKNESLNELTCLAEKPYRLPRKLTEQEGRIGLRKLNETMNDLENSIEEELADATAEEIDRYAETVKRKVEAGDIAGIAALSFLLLGKTKKALDKAAKKAYDTGKTGAAKELGLKDRPATAQKDAQILSMDVNDMSRGYVYELEQKSRSLVKDAVVSGASAAAIATTVNKQAKDEASKMIANISGMLVGQYINRGRSKVFQDNLTDIVSFERSEVLDLSTCPMCMSLDERVVESDDPMSQMDIVHTHCRGVWVPILEVDDRKPDVTGVPKTIQDNFDLVDGRPTVNSFKQLKKPINRSNEEVQKIIRQKLK